jgi:hypothetical protein
MGLGRERGTNAAVGLDMLLTLFLILLVLMALGSAPAWPHSRSWGYYPSGGIGLLVIILVVFFLMSPNHVWW